MLPCDLVMGTACRAARLYSIASFVRHGVCVYTRSSVFVMTCTVNATSQKKDVCAVYDVLNSVVVSFIGQ